MRLSKHYLDTFIEIFSEYIPKDQIVELRLFGSRVRDDLQGGDIDILLVCYQENVRDYLKHKYYEILGKLFFELDEQKIDCLIVSKSELTSKAFAKLAFDKSILLHKWH